MRWLAGEDFVTATGNIGPGVKGAQILRHDQAESPLICLSTLAVVKSVADQIARGVE